MIARCDRCDAKREYANGYRWFPDQAGLGRYRCPECGGTLRAKRKGDREAVLIDARLVPPPSLTPRART